MPSYRFCRPDDIPSLVEAVNDCFAVHFPPTERMTVEGFRAEMKSHDVWPSNSMLTWAEDHPIAVLIGTKRSEEVQIRRIGVRPGEERQGHGRHLLDSLARKLGVLGPPRLVAEVPEEDKEALAFFEACRYRREAVLTDWVREGPAVAAAADLVAPHTVDDLLDEGLLFSGRRSWDRQLPGLRKRGGDLEALAAASPVRWEAGLVVERGDAVSRVLAWGTADGAIQPGSTATRMLELALRTAAAETEGPLTLVGLESDEAPEAWLEALGFAPRRRVCHLAAEAITV